MIPSSRFVELNKNNHDRHTFDCGNEELSRFIQQFALRHRQAGISKTMVLPDTQEVEGKTGICSYYTLSHTEITRETLPANMAKKLPRYPVPVLLIAQLAVNMQCQRQGLGKITLIRSLRHCLDIHAHLSSYAVIVDALDKEVESFYQQYGFQVLDSNNKRTRLFLPMKTVMALFQ